MSKITINKVVYWDTVGGRKMSGKVKQVMSDHVCVKADDGTNYIVSKSGLQPMSKLASLLKVAAGADVNFDLIVDENGDFQLRHIDSKNAKGEIISCSKKDEAAGSIKRRLDKAFIGNDTATEQQNPGPRAPEPQATLPQQQKQTQQPVQKKIQTMGI